MFHDVSEAFGRLWLKPGWNSQNVQSLFSFRIGGTSHPPFESLNIGFHVGDDAQAVIENRRICSNELTVSLDSWVVAEQVHGNRIAVIDEEFRGNGSFDHESSVPSVDGLVTNVKKITLAVLAADCVPVLFYDPVRSVIGTAHSGWKGTLGHIVCNMIETMKTHYGSNPKDILVYVGPSIRKCCYEVSDNVAIPMQGAFHKKVVWPRFHKALHSHLSLQDAIFQDLICSGVSMQNITDCGICTACHSSVLYSHRKENGNTGRLVGAICLTA